jgi:hypothetical protein
MLDEATRNDARFLWPHILGKILSAFCNNLRKSALVSEKKAAGRA